MNGRYSPVEKVAGPRWLFWAMVCMLSSLMPGCRYAFDSESIDVPLSGTPTPATRLPRLNEGATRSLSLLQDDDGANWAVMVQAQPDLFPPPMESRTTLELVRLSDGYKARVQADLVLIRSDRYVAIEQPQKAGDPTRLTMARPGGRVLLTTELPGKLSTLTLSSNDATLLAVTVEDKTPHLILLRSDGTSRRELALPADVTLEHLGQWSLALWPDGEHVLIWDHNALWTVHATRREEARPLRRTKDPATIDRRRGGLLFCGAEGLISVPLGTAQPLTLDPRPCDPMVLRLIDDRILYKQGESLIEYRATTGPVQRVASSVGQILSVGPADELLISRDPVARYGAGIGDGWLGDRQLMLRGRRPTWSSDRSRLRWLENAARSDNTGELYTERLALDETGQTERLLLARNVRQWGELPSGKLLVISHAATRGVYNRLLVVDERARTATWLLEGVSEYVRIPGTRDLLVVANESPVGANIHRYTLPAGL